MIILIPAFSNNDTGLLVTVATLGSFLPSGMLISHYLTSFRVETVSKLLNLCRFSPVCILYLCICLPLPVKGLPHCLHS